MNIVALTALSFSMSMDAFTASIVRGSSDKTLAPQGLQRFLQALKIGLIFGLVEALCPIFGYFVGVLAQNAVQAYDHWVSFILLSGLGLHLIYETLTDNTQTIEKPTSLAKTILIAFATSIDAMVVGVSLAFLNVNIWLAGLMIGGCTTIMTTIGVYLGAKLSEKLGNKAQILGGVVLILIGVFILISHLTEH